MIQLDSRLVQPGDLFIAIPCKDELTHIQDAIENGAEIVFAERGNNVVIVPDARLIASKLARIQYPKQPNTTIAITGTNGKSSVAHFAHQLWHYIGISSANLGTLGLYINLKKIDNLETTILTTPDALHLHKILNYLSENNINNIVFEASSAALDQKRLHSVDLSAAVFTNFASDHLDYHKNREKYFKSKLILFQKLLKPNAIAILNGDDKFILENIQHKNIITFGFNENSNIRAKNINIYSDTIKFDLHIYSKEFKGLEIKLVGKFQLLNVLAAIAIVISSGVDVQKIVNNLHLLKPLNGRMELIEQYNGGSIFVDYAHTTEAFHQMLKTFKSNVTNLVCVFGCGGERDKTKRKEFGKLAQQLADVAIITDDNPRNEDPSSIRKEILKYCPKAIEIANREKAIQFAINIMKPNTTVVIVGKGHENYQIYGSEYKEFSDKKIIINYINRLRQ